MILPLLLLVITSSNDYEIFIDSLHDTIFAEEHRMRERLHTSESMEVVFAARVSDVYVPATIGSTDVEAHAAGFYLCNHDILGAEPASILNTSGLDSAMLHHP